MSPSPVSKKFKKPFKNFDANLFERDLFEDDAGLYRALERLRATVASGGTSDVLTGLLNTDDNNSKLFEYTFAVIDEGTAFLLREGLCRGFDPAASAAPSSSILALNKLAKFFYFLDYPPDYAKPESLTYDFRFVQLSQDVLSIIRDAGFLHESTVNTLQQGEDEESTKMTKKKGPQKQVKHAKRSRRGTLRMDEKPFLDLEESVPTSREEAVELALKLLSKQTELLSRFIDILRDPNLSEVIREQCVPVMNDSTLIHEVPQSGATEGDATVCDTVSIEGSPSAYPRVQPIKAALFFDSAEGFGEWRIFVSTKAMKDLRNCHRDNKVFKVVLKKLQELSNGFFSDDNHKKLQGPSMGVPIFEAKLTGDLRIVYQIDLKSDFEGKCETQGIRVYGIFTHARMDDRMWASLSAQLGAQGSEYRRRIAYRTKPLSIGDNVYLPKSWPDVYSGDGVAKNGSSSPAINGAYRDQIHEWLVLEKYAALSKALLNWILSDRDSAPIFSVSPYERDIIEHPSSCYVLGRSGTGKTTTMAFKMFGIERAAQAHANELESKPRQLFVTQSPVLASRVKEFYSKFSAFLSASTGTLRTYMAEEAHDEHGGMGDPEADEYWQGHLPKRFSELQDHHFPLFLTFDKLCELVEADLGITFARPRYTKEHRRAERRYRTHNTNAVFELDDALDEDFGALAATTSLKSTKEAMRKSRVDFDSFLANYWHHFPQDLKKRLDPSLVFSEFLGNIEGSQESLNAGSTYLSREEYIGLSERTRSTFAGQREKIYQLFNRYIELKKEYGDYDLADRSQAIFRAMKEDYQGSVDYLYVDEAQDNLIVDAFFLRRLCRNPHGLFWAGDTAQTIAIGSSFRFDDLKASLYSFERELYPSTPEKVLVQPVFFQLATNYRSHGGIVNCAGLMIELITRFWPYSIDALQEEKGIVDGSRPIFFTGWNDGTARYEQFLLSENGDTIEFGAQQCILVRNDQARRILREQVGDIGIILTLYESKGLEFDDVLLYNFFEDSSCSVSQWRVVLNLLPEPEEGTKAAPRFDELLHAGICTELKFLYVAITRARKNIWIMDRSEKGEPMKTLLVQREVVEVCTPENAPKLAVASKPEDWAITGRQLFEHGQYQQAAECFDRAKLYLERDIAGAYFLRLQARNVPRSSGEQARIGAFKEAGCAFSDCARKAPTSGKKYYHIAAECFVEARAYDQAGKAYEGAEEYSDAARCFLKAAMFDDAVRIVQTKEPVDSTVAERVVGASRVHFVHVGELEKAMEMKLFDSDEELLRYMEDCGFDTERAAVLEKIGKIQEAADIHFREGRERQAVQLLLGDARKPGSLERATDYLLSSLWRQYSFGLGPGQGGSGDLDPFYYIKQIDRTTLPQEVMNEFDMFDAIRRGDREYLLTSYKEFLAEPRKNPQAATIILDYLLAPGYSVDDIQDAVNYLQACVAFAGNLRQLWNHPNPTENERTQRLFSFRQLTRSEDEFLITDGTFLANYVASSRKASVRATVAGLVIGRLELLLVIRDFVATRLLGMVQSSVETFGRIRKQHCAGPCLYHMTQGRCSKSDCFRQHINLKSANIGWFNIRVRIILLELLFLQMADFALVTFIDRYKLRNQCLAELFQLLNPPCLALGSMANISINHIRDISDGMRAVSTWIESRVYGIKPNRFHESWFLDGIVEVATLAFLRDREKSRRLLYNAQFCTGRGIHFQDRIQLEKLKIPELIRCLDTFDPKAIESGCLFIRNVIMMRAVIGIDRLCHIAEVLSAACTLLFKGSTQEGFHNTLLPRSWLFVAIPRLNLDSGNVPPLPMDLLIESSATLAHHLLIGEDIEYLRGASGILKTLSIQRICRAIFLVAYNTNEESRVLALRSMAMLRQAAGSTVYSILKPYILSRSWSELRTTAECSVPSSNLDVMLHLVQEGHNRRLFSPEAKTVPIGFKNRDDLLARFSPPPRPASFKLSAAAKVFVPRSVYVPVTSDTDGSNQSMYADDNTSAIADDVADSAGDDGEDNDNSDMPAHPSVPVPAIILPNKEMVAGCVILRFLRRVIHHRKEQAVLRIQRWYKAMRIRFEERECTGLRGKLARKRRVCFVAERTKEWPSKHHRSVFCWIIPDLLVCLDVLQTAVQSNKSEAKRHLATKATDSRIDYEEVHLRLTRANASEKRFESLKGKIRVADDWHTTRTLQDIRDVVQEILSLFEELGMEGAEYDMCLQVKQFVQQKKNLVPQQKKLKPSLNTGDLYDCY